jgi:hypothetical protein
MLIVYTDDCLFFAKEDVTIDNIISALKSTFALEDQGTVHDYLGIHIQRDPINRTITMTQPGLINSILTDLNLLGDLKSKSTPALGILHPDVGNTPRLE